MFYGIDSIFRSSVLFTRYFGKHSSSLLSYHTYISLNESVLGRGFLGFHFVESIILGFLSVGKYYLGRLEIPNSTDPCLFACQVHPFGMSIMLILN